MNGPARPARLTGPWLLVVLLALLPITAKTVLNARALLSDPACHYADTAAPLLTSYDGYAFLRAASLAPPGEGVGCTPGAAPPPPALSQLVAATARLAGTTPQVAAFWLPPLLAGLLPLTVFVWGRRFYGDPAALAAALAAGTCPYFLEVTGLGRCDTDGLIPTLFLAAALAAQAAAVARGGQARLRAGALYVLFAGLSWWWWTPGGSLALALPPLAVAAALLSCPRPALGRWFGFAALGLTAVLGAAWGMAAALSLPLPQWLSYVLRHAALAFGLTPDTAALARSVIELRPLSFDALGRQSLGHPVVLALACLGLARLWQRNRPAALLLSPLALAGAASLRSGRMVLLFFPLAALGLGAVLDWLLCRLTARRFNTLPVRAALAVLLTGTLLVPAGLYALSTLNRPPFLRDDDRLALTVGRDTPPGTVVFAWWDDGYFLRYRALRPVFFDGGSQSAEDCFAAAWPLAAADADLAADWIVYFAHHGPGEIGRLAARFGSRDAAVTWLLRLFASPLGQRPAVLASLPGPPLNDPSAFFFPLQPACLVLRLDMLSKSGFWLAFAAGPEALIPPNPPNHVDVLPRTGLLIDAAAGRLRLPDTALAKGYVSVPTVWDVEAVAPLPENLTGRADPVLFYGAQLPFVAIADQAASRSLALRLLLAPDSAPTRFAKISYDPQVGGAWIVLPRK